MSCCSGSCGTDCGCPETLTADGPGEVLTILKTGQDVELDNFIDQVHVTIPEGDPNPITITLPQAPRIGQQVLVVPCQGGATVTGGDCNDIVGGDVLVTQPSGASGGTVTFTFGACCSWVPSASTAQA